MVPEDIQEAPQFSSIDVSFISLTKVLLPVRNLLTEDGEIVCLIKPQFEAGREKVGKKGVVRDPAVHLEVIEKVMAYAMSIALEPQHLSFSPIKGPEEISNICFISGKDRKARSANPHWKYHRRRWCRKRTVSSTDDRGRQN